jgi:hypothetical protein
MKNRIFFEHKDYESSSFFSLTNAKYDSNTSKNNLSGVSIKKSKMKIKILILETFSDSQRPARKIGKEKKSTN